MTEEDGMNFELDGQTLVITAPLTFPGKLSASGKSTVHATTRGAVQVPGSELQVVLTVYTPR